MPSTYTGSGIELIGDGEQSGSWGTTTNTNLQIINRLVSEAGTISLSGTTHTLTISDGTLSDGQYAVLVFGGAPSGTNTVTISPNDAKRVFIVSNTTNQNVVLTQGSGGDVTVGVNSKAVVYADGAGASAAVIDITPVTPTLSAIGALTPTDGNFIVGNGTTWVAESGNTVLQSIGVTATTAELNILDGVTATTAELNILDGVTATTAELNILDGVTATTAEINTLDGIAPSGAGFGFVPQGGIIMWSGSIASIPSGWLICDGTNGTPDLRSRFVVGAGSTYAVGATGGAATVTLTTAQLPGHTHAFSATTDSAGSHTHNISIATFGATEGLLVGPGGGALVNTTTTGLGGEHTHTLSGTTDSTGGGNSHENLPPYYALAYIMKA